MADKVDEHQLVHPAHCKARLKWTKQLHQCFVDAVSQLGGADKATPKSVMRVMGIPGITLYHLKSHLQKYRLAKNKDPQVNDKNEDTMSADCRPAKHIIPFFDEDKTETKFHDSKTMLHLQLEVQRKIQEQIEVQKHLQMRIEAQGKYLQSVVMKAQETLASYNLNSAEIDFSQATSLCKKFLNTDCSTDSCLTSSDVTELKNGKQDINIENNSDCSNNWSVESNEINRYYGKNVEDIDLNR